jgi:selenocysteine lyase/cysteine desulfurase
MLMRAALDAGALRTHEFARLDAGGLAYLDYTGAALYPASLVRRDARRLATCVLGNPHSESAPSSASTEALDEARRLTLRLLSADPGEYDVVFTANATAAIRILAEAFPFTGGSRLVLSADNHNSVNGLRVAASRRRALIEYVGLDDDLRPFNPVQWLPRAVRPSLFAYPAQSNFSGVRHGLEWVAAAQERGYRVLLDAAAFVPTKSLSLSKVPADFVALSFYKMFGYPTGVGALVARREALAALRRRYFGGGTVQFVSVQNRVSRGKHGSGRFEDGTPNFLAIPAVADGLRWIERLGMARIEQHVQALTRLLLDRLESLGDRVIIHGPRDGCDRGGTVAFNLRRNGRVLPYEAVELAARERGIALRGGCFCNPGAAEHAFSIPADRERACLRGPFSVQRLRECLGSGAVGALRASVGIPTTEQDLDRLGTFVEAMTAPNHSSETRAADSR